MSMRLQLVVVRPIILVSALFIAAIGAAAASSDMPPAEARLERQIAAELEKGQVAEAQVDADAAVKRFPDSALLRRRRGQVRLCLAIQRGEQFQQTLEDAIWAQNLAHVVDWLHNGQVLRMEPPPDHPERVPTADQLQALEQFKLFASGAVTTSFQEKALRELKESEPLLQHRTEALSAAFADLKEARRLGDKATERELTDLWGQVLVLLWRQEPARLQRLGTARAEAVAKALAPFVPIQPDAVLRSAAALAKGSPSDPAALAGAADVISVVAGVTKKPDPLRAHLHALLDRGYLQNGAAYEPQLSEAVREIYRQTYRQIRDAKEPDVVAAPATVALQLYHQALEQDAGYSLPYLRPRLYLLRLAFEPEAARPLLDEIRRHEPGNAVVPLEEARQVLLLDGQPLAAIRSLQEATRFPAFSRSYLVAVPKVLRPSLKFQAGLREWIEQAWPGYEWLFSTLILMRHPQGQPGLLRVELQLYERLGAQVDLLALQTGLAERLSQAPDYADQAKAVYWLLDGLRDRVHEAEKQQFPPDQQAAARQQLADQQRTFASFPRRPATLCLTMQGLDLLTAEQHLPENSWPRLILGEPGYFLFYWDPSLGPEFHRASE